MLAVDLAPLRHTDPAELQRACAALDALAMAHAGAPFDGNGASASDDLAAASPHPIWRTAPRRLSLDLPCLKQAKALAAKVAAAAAI